MDHSTQNTRYYFLSMLNDQSISIISHLTSRMTTAFILQAHSQSTLL